MLPDQEQGAEALLKTGFKALLAQANAVIEVISIQDFKYIQDDPNTVVVDIRDANERERDGTIPGSVHAPRGMLEFDADPECPAQIAALDPEKKLVLHCGTGGRSALAVKNLQDMGFSDVRSLAGGFAA